MKSFVLQLALKERCPSKFSLSVCYGVFIALSPFMGVHTAMIFIFAWALRLNLPITFAVAYLNNPWTVGPLLFGEYAFGKWIVGLLGWSKYLHNPAWVSSFNKMLTHYVGLPKICFWSFIIGASVLTLVVSLLLYPVIKYLFTLWVPPVHEQRKISREAYN